MALLTARTAADRLGVSYSTLKQWIHQGVVRTSHTSGGHHRLRDAQEEAHRCLQFVGLNNRAAQRADALGGPDRKRLELAKALAMRPRLLLLDEVMGGLNQAESEEIIQLILDIRKEGITQMVIEHDMKAIMRLSDRIVVLNSGEKLAEGSPQEIVSNAQVIEAYLGPEE